MMTTLREAEDILRLHPQLADLQLHLEGKELHLARGDERFARLIPTEHEQLWRLELFQNRERWEPLEFRGTLRECFGCLTENVHYQFWEG